MRIMLKTLLITALAVSSASLAAASHPVPPETVVLHLNQGNVEGVRENIRDSRFFYSFKGIPFAAPPVGQLRFKDPSPAASWGGVRKSFTAPACPQLDYAAFMGGKLSAKGDEDCLYLNVYTPKPSASAKLPVMVFIHGGGFIAGDAISFGGSPRPLLKKDIVLVSIQYRLGALGFLSTGDSLLPGNLGLKDQTFALEWVKENIIHFGGDPDMVTIFGISAGGASVHYHILSPYSKGLFRHAIMQSGSALCPWALRNDHAARALKLAKYFKCPGLEEDETLVDSKKILQCFMEKTPEEIVMASRLDTVWLLPFYMVPRVDGDYLPDHPGKLIREGRHNKVNIISGVCKNEGASYLMSLLVEGGWENFLTNLDNVAPKLTGLDNEENSPYLARRVIYHYNEEFDHLTNDTLRQFEKIFAISLFIMGHDEATSLHGRDSVYGKMTYRYELQHAGPKMMPPFSETFSKLPAENWVMHGADSIYIFDTSGIPFLLNRTQDLFLSDIMVDLWTNFAKTGNPTPNLDLGFIWEPMNSQDDFRFLSMIPAPQMKEDNRAENRDFWRNLPLKANKALFPQRFDKGRCV